MASDRDEEKDPCVYFIQNGDSGLIKIGMTKVGVYDRFGALQQMNGGPLYIRGIVRHDKPKTLERILHQMFKAERVHGEWFTPSDRLLEHIRLYTHQVEQPVVAGQITCPSTCEQCRTRIAVTRDGKLCRSCLRRWAARESPIDMTSPWAKRGKDHRASLEYEQDPSFENGVRRLEDSTD